MLRRVTVERSRCRVDCIERRPVVQSKLHIRFVVAPAAIAAAVAVLLYASTGYGRPPAGFARGASTRFEMSSPRYSHVEADRNDGPGFVRSAPQDGPAHRRQAARYIGRPRYILAPPRGHVVVRV